MVDSSFLTEEKILKSEAFPLERLAKSDQS